MGKLYPRSPTVIQVHIFFQLLWLVARWCFCVFSKPSGLFVVLSGLLAPPAPPEASPEVPGSFVSRPIAMGFGFRIYSCVAPWRGALWFFIARLLLIAFSLRAPSEAPARPIATKR